MTCQSFSRHYVSQKILKPVESSNVASLIVVCTALNSKLTHLSVRPLVRRWCNVVQWMDDNGRKQVSKKMVNEAKGPTPLINSLRDQRRGVFIGRSYDAWILFITK